MTEFHAVVGTLGDRFLLLRVETAAEEQLTKSRLTPGAATDVRQRVAAAVAGLFVGAARPAARTRAHDQQKKYKALSDQAIREIVRLRAASFATASAARLTRCTTPKARPACRSPCSSCRRPTSSSASSARRRRNSSRESLTTARHNCASRRCRALTDSPQTTRDIANALNLPTITARRTLEDLAAQRLAVRDKGGDDWDKKAGGAHRWRRAK